MPLKKSHINLIFTLVVLALGMAAVGPAIMQMKKSSPLPTTAPSQNQLPESHPPIDYSKELANLEQLSAKDPRSPEYQTRIGNIYYDMHQYDKAVAYYQQSLTLQPKNPSVETDLAACFYYLGQYDQALEKLNKVLGYQPNFPEALFNKGIVLIHGKKDEKSGVSVWEDLLRSNPDYPRRAEIQKSIDDLKSSLK
jgi:tetratricopeptide (TPR) repeat protein